MESHLLQMRGLKHPSELGYKRSQYVASFTDAWIETRYKRIITTLPKVASFTDAWIETKERNIMKLRKEESHLLQMRGLKP